MNSLIQERLAAVPGYVLMGELEAKEEIDRVRAALSDSANHPEFAVVAECDASDYQLDQIRSWLRSLAVDPEETAAVLWPSLRAGALMKVGTFCDVFDDLWYPSADDVWVRAESGDWILEMDHEEQFRLFRKRLKSV